MIKKKIYIAILFFNSIAVYAQGWITSVPLKLKSTVNTNANELSPIFYADSSTLYFTKNNEKKQYKGYLDQDIWFAKQQKIGEWSEAEPVKELNNVHNNSVLGFSEDGTKIYLLDSYTENKGYVDGIAYSTKTSDGWSKPIHFLIEGLKIEGEFCGFTINKEENVIVISYAGPLSKGEEDLYVCFKQQNNVWSAPIHLGEDINSKGFEISPFLTYDSDTLFFASNGMGGMGGSDIFFSVRKDDTWQNWSKPKNLGAPINSPSFDAYYHSIGNRIFWSSDREMKGNEDIFYVQKIKPPKLKVDVTETKSVTVFHGKDGKVEISVSGGVEPYTYLWSDGSTSKDLENVPDGEYLVVVTDAVDQQVTLKAVISTPKIDEGKDLAVLFDPPVVLYYDLDKFSLTEESRKSLEKVVEVLNDNPNVKIEVRSYTDCQGDKAYNLQLSKSRSKTTVDYLKSKVKNPERIVGKGFGETIPVVNCDCDKAGCSDEELQKNRRTEFVVVK